MLLDVVERALPVAGSIRAVNFKLVDQLIGKETLLELIHLEANPADWTLFVSFGPIVQTIVAKYVLAWWHDRVAEDLRAYAAEEVFGDFGHLHERAL